MFNDDIQALAIDIGHLKTTIGFVGNELPQYICHSVYTTRDSIGMVHEGDSQVVFGE